jgi:hypothetical protein
MMKKCFKCKIFLSPNIDNIEKNICADCENEERVSKMLNNAKGSRSIHNIQKKQIKKVRNIENY